MIVPCDVGHSVRMITVGHRTISAQLQHVSGHFCFWSAKMSVQSKRVACSQGEGPPAKKRGVLKSTVDKWVVENDKALCTSTWLKCEVDSANRSRVVALKCSVCCQFRDKLVSMRNYSAAYVEGSSSLRTSSFKDHAASDMHSRAMLLLKKKVRKYNTRRSTCKLACTCTYRTIIIVYS